jgi:hypothetical protein
MLNSKALYDGRVKPIAGLGTLFFGLGSARKEAFWQALDFLALRFYDVAISRFYDLAILLFYGDPS